MKKKTKRMAVETGAGIFTAAALAAAGAYLLSTKEGKKKTKEAKAWIGRAKKEIGEKIGKAKSMREGDYKQLVENAVRRYGNLEKADVAEIVRVAKEMKSDWARLKGHAKKMATAVHKKKSAPETKTSARRSRNKK